MDVVHILTRLVGEIVVAEIELHGIGESEDTFVGMGKDNSLELSWVWRDDGCGGCPEIMRGTSCADLVML